MAGRTGKKAEESLAELERRLGHVFDKPGLLTLALTHRSYVYDVPGAKPSAEQADPSKDNEQLEFLGDAALGLLVAEALCKRFPASREGELTRLRAKLVSRKHLGEVGARLEFGRWLRLGPTTAEAGGRTNAALISNAAEAIIAALFLDGGIDVARGFVEREVLAGLNPADTGPSRDAKTILQELVQAEGLGRVQYVPLGESGPGHQRLFKVEVRLDGPGSEMGALAEAEGPSKKQAQQEAARLSVVRLEARHG